MNDAYESSAFRLSVQALMQEMERLQAKGDVAEDEVRALEEDMTGKVMISATHVLASNLLRDHICCADFARILARDSFRSRASAS